MRKAVPNQTRELLRDNIPPAAVQALEQEAAGVMHGTVTLALHFKDGHLIRYTTGHERSFVPGRPMTGDHNGRQ